VAVAAVHFKVLAAVELVYWVKAQVAQVVLPGLVVMAGRQELMEFGVVVLAGLAVLMVVVGEAADIAVACFLVLAVVAQSA